LIFIHGGPGYNSYGFEVSVAERLAATGYYVVVYDERGAGRSAPGLSLFDFSYRAYTQDLKQIIDTLQIRHPILMGHSFGGSLALKFMDSYPGVARAAFLIAAPVSFPQTFRAIIDRAANINSQPTWNFTTYRQQVANLVQIQNVAAAFYCPFPIYGVRLNGDRCIPPETIGLAFAQAMANGSYSTSRPTLEEKAVTAELEASPQKKLLSDMKSEPVVGFAYNENYAALDLFASLQRHRARVFGMYAAEDGLFDQGQLSGIESTLPAGHFVMIPNSSHGIFQQQRAKFIEQVGRFDCELRLSGLTDNNRMP
jgi:proline iminopeptidase